MDDLLLKARKLAAQAAKQPLVKEQILLGRHDAKPKVLRLLRELQRQELLSKHGVA